MEKGRVAAFASASVLALIPAGGASAQEAALPANEVRADTQPQEMVGAQAAPSGAAQTPEADSAAGVGDIIVTAQKRSESANTVPLSITAITGADLIARGITSTADLAKVVPGLTFAQSPYNVPVYTIRGIGFYETTLSATSAVAVYTDEVPLPFPAMTKAAGLDLERVEVLKGPQGTLFGQNATGGAINYIAAKPGREPAAGITGSFGRFNTFDLQGYVSTPISDTLSVRAAARGVLASGWQKSYTRDDENGRQDQFQGRILLQWEPSSNFRVLLNVNGWVDQGEPQAPQAIAITPQVPARLPPRVANYPLAPRNARAADWTPGFPKRDDRFWQAALRADLDLTDDITFTSITAFQNLDTDAQTDFDGLSLENVDTTLSGKIRSFYQEARVGGQTGDLIYTVGANYGRDRVFDSQSNAVRDSSNIEVIPGLPFSVANNFTQQNVETYAGFANVEWEFVDGLSVQGAARYTKSERAFSGCASGDFALSQTFVILQSVLNGAVFGVPSAVPIPTGQCVTLTGIGTTPANSFLPGLIQDNLNEDNVSWRAGLKWEPSARTIVYGNVSRGYKSGSFPTLSAGFEAQYVPVPQESVTAYEVGFKLSAFDRRAQINGAAFYYDYKDKQFKGKFTDAVFGVLEGLTTIPKSRVWGLEAGVQAEPFDGLKLFAAGTYLNTKIQEGAGFNSSGVAVGFKGTLFPYTPKYIVQGDAEYKWGLSDDLGAFVGGSVLYNSRTNASLGGEALFTIRAYTLIDVRAGIENEDNNWRLSLFGRNVTNEYYWNNVVRAQDTTIRFAGMPVTYGIQFSKQF